MLHELKCWPEFFQAVKSGKKNFEIRYNDRNYQVGDVLELHEFDPDKLVFTDEPPILREVTYILSNYISLNVGVVCMALKAQQEPCECFTPGYQRLPVVTVAIKPGSADFPYAMAQSMELRCCPNCGGALVEGCE